MECSYNTACSRGLYFRDTCLAQLFKIDIASELNEPAKEAVVLMHGYIGSERLYAEYLLLRRFLEGDDNTAVVDDDSELVDKFPHENKYRRQTKMLAVVRGGADQLPYLVRLALNKGNGKPFLVNRCGIAFPRAQPGVFEFCVDVHNFQQVGTISYFYIGDNCMSTTQFNEIEVVTKGPVFWYPLQKSLQGID